MEAFQLRSQFNLKFGSLFIVPISFKLFFGLPLLQKIKMYGGGGRGGEGRGKGDAKKWGGGGADLSRAGPGWRRRGGLSKRQFGAAEIPLPELKIFILWYLLHPVDKKLCIVRTSTCQYWLFLLFETVKRLQRLHPVTWNLKQKQLICHPLFL